MASVRPDGTINVKIIAPGWGSSGYYTEEVLRRDGPQKFAKGVKLYWDHPTRTEESERPERSLNELAAELTEDARYVEDHPAGPGLYAEAKVFDRFRKPVDELAPHIGVSIRALGKAMRGQAEGKTGPIITEISAAKSVDFVTTPGAGGQVLQLFEAQRQPAPNIQPDEGVTMEENQKRQEAEQQIATMRAENARLQEALLLREASDFVAGELGQVKNLPEMTRNRLLRDLAARPVVKDGKLDQGAYKAQIAEAVRSEIEYLAGVTGSGQIRGFGGSANTEQSQDYTGELKESFQALGMSDTAAEIAAKGR